MPAILPNGASTVTNRTTAANGAMFCRTSSSGPEKRSATWRMPAVWTLIKLLAHMTVSSTNAATVSAMMWSRRWAEARRNVVGQRAHCAVVPGISAGTI